MLLSCAVPCHAVVLFRGLIFCRHYFTSASHQRHTVPSTHLFLLYRHCHRHCHCHYRCHFATQDGKILANELDVVEGMKFDRGYISPYFVTDNKTQAVEFEKPLILLCESKISNLQQMLPLLESVVKSQRPLLIIAEDVESEALATLVRILVILGILVMSCPV